MEINLTATYSKYADILPFVTDESRKELLNKAAEIRDPYALTLADFFACAQGDFSCVVKDVNNPTTGEVLWRDNFVAFMDELGKTIKRLSIPQTAEQKQASANCLQVEWQEGMLVFVRKYFGLHSFSEAERVLVADYLLAKKDDYNTTIFERNMARIQRQKMKLK